MGGNSSTTKSSSVMIKRKSIMKQLPMLNSMIEIDSYETQNKVEYTDTMPLLEDSEKE